MYTHTYIFCVDTIYNICVILVHPCHPYEIGIIVIPFQGLSTMRLSNCPKSHYTQEVAVILEQFAIMLYDTTEKHANAYF